MTPQAALPLLMLGPLGVQELLLVAGICMLLFGGKRIAESMRGLGQGIRAFKEGVVGKDEKKEEESK